MSLAVVIMFYREL